MLSKNIDDFANNADMLVIQILILISNITQIPMSLDLTYIIQVPGDTDTYLGNIMNTLS